VRVMSSRASMESFMSGSKDASDLIFLPDYR
jgi:hypothetical protein